MSDTPFDRINRIASYLFIQQCDFYHTDSYYREYYRAGLELVESIISREFSDLAAGVVETGDPDEREAHDAMLESIERMTVAGIKPNKRGQFRFEDAVKFDAQLSAEEKQVLPASCEAAGKFN